MNRKMIASLAAAGLLLVSTSAMAMTPGTYEGSAQGQNDLVKVAVTVSEDKIEKVEILGH